MHNGNLEGNNPYIVEHIDILDITHDVRIGHDEAFVAQYGAHDEVWLSAKQALSLLSWLEQERSILEQLIKGKEAS